MAKYLDLTGLQTFWNKIKARLTAIENALAGYVPTSRTVNSKALTDNISLTASDVGAATSGHTHNYAGSSSAGGTANSAIHLSASGGTKLWNSGQFVAARPYALLADKTIGTTGNWGTGQLFKIEQNNGYAIFKLLLGGSSSSISSTKVQVIESTNYSKTQLDKLIKVTYVYTAGASCVVRIYTDMSLSGSNWQRVVLRQLDNQAGDQYANFDWDVFNFYSNSNNTNMVASVTGTAATNEYAAARLWGNADTASAAQSGSTLETALNGKVPTSRTVNGKALTGNISLSASDVGAATSGHNHDSTYMKASSGNKSLSFGGNTTIGTVNGSNVNLEMPNALAHTEYSSTQTPDFNSYTTPGTYALSYSSGSNIPPISATQRSGPSSGILTVAKSVINSTTVITQVWIDSFYTECVIRRKEGSTWKNWTFPYAGTNISLNSSTYSDQQVTGVLPVANGGTGQTSLSNVTVGSATTASGLDSPYVTLPKDTRSSPDAFICVVAAKPNNSEMKSYLNATDTKAGIYASYGQSGGWVAYRNTDGHNSWGTANVGDKGHPVFINSKGEFTKCGESAFSAQAAGVVFSKTINSAGAVDIAALPNYCLIALYNNTTTDYSITCGGVSYNLKSKAGKLFFKAGGSVCYGV